MSRAVEQRAADWIARRYAGLSPAEEAELQRWLAADVRHAEAFAELDRTWDLLDRLRDDGASSGSDPVMAGANGVIARARFRWRPVLSAAAALVMLGLVVLGTRGPRSAGDWSEEIATAVGVLRTATLPDGSMVRVNTDSLVRIRYARGVRSVQLVRGEAYFTVAKDPARPFRVEAGDVAVRAVGTAFNVRLRPEGVEVLVTEGKVSVEDAKDGAPLLAPRPSAAAPLLVAGEKAVLPAVAAGTGVRGRREATVLPPTELQRAVAWHDLRIEFVAAPLAEIVAEFNRYNPRPIVIADPALAARKFGGSFRGDDPATFVRLLQDRFGVEAAREGEATVLRAGASAPR